MASAPESDDVADVFDQFLIDRGHEPAQQWDRSYQKKQCPECRGLHDLSASHCTVCGWSPL